MATACADDAPGASVPVYAAPTYYSGPATPVTYFKGGSYHKYHHYAHNYHHALALGTPSFYLGDNINRGTSLSDPTHPADNSRAASR
jgi:hypothetical protein